MVSRTALPTAAGWIVDSDLPWQQLVGFGPAGFDSHARLRFLPDPVGPGRSENDADAGRRTNQLPALLRGAGHPRPRWAPQPVASPSMPELPKVVVPHRAYWLFRGPLGDVGTWDTAQGWPGRRRLDAAGPAFVWPADHAWCVAQDVDPHWAGIGGTRGLIARLITDPRLDVVPADPTMRCGQGQR
jgi:hypothetical protein